MNFDQFPKIDNFKKEVVKTPENKIKEGVDFVFEQNPELGSVGTKEQYSKYLEIIFPDSKVKNITFHGSNYKIEKFEKRKNPQNYNRTGFYKAGWFFSNSVNTAGAYIDNKYIVKVSNLIGLSKNKNPTIHASLLNIQNFVEEDR